MPDVDFRGKTTDKILNNVDIFDVYQGEGIEIGKKSVALGLTFLDASLL